ncbi:MAG: hypothetical protein LBO72_07345 [Helicobacteraceae bacterium]|jgi:hypothetical protein|nr:hypothetical protein [Helicobacteraceae bacterium]
MTTIFVPINEIDRLINQFISDKRIPIETIAKAIELRRELDALNAIFEGELKAIDEKERLANRKYYEPIVNRGSKEQQND